MEFLEAASGRILFTMTEEKSGIIRALAISSDSRYAASSDELRRFVWDLKTGRSISRFPEKDTPDNARANKTAMAFSSNDRRVLAATTNGRVVVWDVDPEQERPAIILDAGPLNKQEFRCAAFSSDRERLVTGSRTGAVEIWDLRNGKKLRTFGDHTGGVLSVAYSGDGRLVLSVGSDNSVRVCVVATGKQLGTLESDHTQVRCVAFSPDSRRALFGDLYGLVHLWDLATGKEVCRLAGHTMAVNAVAFSPDGRRAVSGSDDRSVRLWQLPESGAVGDTSSNKSAQPPTQTSVAAPPVAATIVESTSPVTPAAAKPADPPKSGTKVTGDPAESITNAIGMKLALIPAGEFLMGSSKDEDNDAYDNELPRHRVRITRPFFLGVTEVTQGQYRCSYWPEPEPL